MKKKVLTSVVLGTATVTLGMASNAKADQINVTKHKIGDETKITTTTTKTVASQDKIKQDKAAISDQQKVINHNKNEITNNKAKVNQDSKKVTDAQTTVSQNKTAIQNAKKTVDNKKTSIQNAQEKMNALKKNQPSATDIQKNKSAQKEAQKKIDVDKKAVNHQQVVVNKAEKDKKNAQNAYDQIQNKFNKAQTTYDSEQKKVIDDQTAINNSQQNIKQDQDKINNQQKMITNDQQAIKQDQDKINQSSIKLKEDRKKLIEDQQKLDHDQQILANNQAAVDTTKEKLNNIQNQLKNYPTLGTLPQGLKNAINNRLAESNQNWVDAVSKNGSVENVNNPNDDERIDPDNLTNNQKIEVNKYAVQLINSYLQQMDKQPAKTNQNMIDLANAVVQVYNENNWNPFADHTGDPRGTGENNAHFATALDNKEIMRKYGLNTAWSGMSENVGMTLLNGDCTMNDLKNALATTIVEMISDDAGSGWGHAINFENASYVGVAVDKYNNIHFITVNGNTNPSQIEDKSKFTNNFDLGNPSSLQEKANQLQKQLIQQQNKVEQDLTNINSDKQNISNNQEQIKKDTPKNLQIQLERDEVKLKHDQAILNSYQHNLTHNQQLLANLKKRLIQDTLAAKEAQKSSVAAKTKFDNAKEKLDKAIQNLDNEKNKLANLDEQLKHDKNTLANLQKTASQYQSKQAALKDAEASVIKAKKEYDDAVKKLNQAQNNYNNSVKLLNKAQQTMNNDMDALIKAQQAYIDAQKKLEQFNDILKNDEKVVTTTDVKWVKDNNNATSTHSIHSANTPNKTSEVFVGTKKTGHTIDIPTSTVANTAMGNRHHTLFSSQVAYADSLDVNNAAITNLTPKIVSTKKTSKIKMATVNNHKQLPQTGDKDSNMSLLGSLALSLSGILAGLGVARKKRHE